jgi:hypothetical protein
MPFYIYENWQAGAHKAKLHRGSCGHCKDGRGKAGGYDPKHAKWSERFDNLESARSALSALPNVIERSECRCIQTLKSN